MCRAPRMAGISARRSRLGSGRGALLILLATARQDVSCPPSGQGTAMSVVGAEARRSALATAKCPATSGGSMSAVADPRSGSEHSPSASPVRLPEVVFCVKFRRRETSGTSGEPPRLGNRQQLREDSRRLFCRWRVVGAGTLRSQLDKVRRLDILPIVGTKFPGETP